MAKRQKRLEGASLIETLPALIGKNINIVEKNGTAHKVTLKNFLDNRVQLVTMRNNAIKKEKFTLNIEDIAEIIYDYPADIDEMQNQ